MSVLHLGVIDIPYAYDEKRPVGQGKKRKLKATTSMTTGDVAEILEDKYHLMELFFETYSEKIVDVVNESLAGAIESVAMGAPALDPFAAGTQGINELFKTFILSGEAERLGIPGTPTKAALAGVSHRLKHPYAKDNPRRVSFRDTGMYVDHFTSWID